jgi:hypothetical protein
MRIFSVVRDYLVWHYSNAISDIFHIWWNYLWFINHLFSVPDVFMTWLSPWKRLQEQKVNIVTHTEDFFANIFVNIMMRMVGFVVRTALLFIALCAFLITIIGGVLFIVLWIVLPLIIAHFVVNGITLLLS